MVSSAKSDFRDKPKDLFSFRGVEARERRWQAGFKSSLHRRKICRAQYRVPLTLNAPFLLLSISPQGG